MADEAYRFVVATPENATPERQAAIEDANRWVNTPDAAEDAPEDPTSTRDGEGERTDDSAAEDVADQTQEMEEGDESGESDAEEERDEARPPRQTRRVKQVLRQRDEAREEAQALREELIRTQERLAIRDEQRVAADATEPEPLVRPDPDDYETDAEYQDAFDAYIDARTDRRWEARQRQVQAEVEAAEMARQADENTAFLRDSFARSRERHADFDERLQTSAPATQTVYEACLYTSDPYEVMYHLASNPEKLAALNQQTSFRAVRNAIHTLERELFAPPPPRPPPAEPPKRGLQPLENALPADGVGYDPDRDGYDHRYNAWARKHIDGVD